eukprot:scaffold4502_cov119-Isochrysis_galbana.AAC.20
MARAPNTAPLAGLAGHVSRTAAGVIKWPRQAEYDAEAWKAATRRPGRSRIRARHAPLGATVAPLTAMSGSAPPSRKCAMCRTLRAPPSLLMCCPALTRLLPAPSSPVIGRLSDRLFLLASPGFGDRVSRRLLAACFHVSRLSWFAASPRFSPGAGRHFPCPSLFPLPWALSHRADRDGVCTTSKSARTGEAGDASGSGSTLTRARHRERANPNGASEASQPRGQLQADARPNGGTNPRCNASKHTKRAGAAAIRQNFRAHRPSQRAPGHGYPSRKDEAERCEPSPPRKPPGKARKPPGYASHTPPARGTKMEMQAKHATVQRTAEPDGGDVQRDMEFGEELEMNEAEAKTTAGVGLERRP